MKRSLLKIVFFFISNSILLILILLGILMTFLSDKFFTLPNWINILNNYAVTGIAAFAVAVVLIAGGIDLSFGSILVSCAILATFLQKYPIGFAIILPLFLGAFMGLFNGLIVGKIGVDSLMTTLATQGLFYSILLLITGGLYVLGSTDKVNEVAQQFFHFIGQGKIINIPVAIYILIATCLSVWFILKNTFFGKYIYAHGSQREALYCAGINSSNVYMFSFIFSGILLAIAGIVLSARLISVRPTEGGKYLMVVLTAVILSGASLSGGKGSVFNVLVAVIVLAVIDNAMVLLSIQYKDQQIIRGSIFILSIIYNNLMTKYQTVFSKKYLYKV